MKNLNVRMRNFDFMGNGKILTFVIPDDDMIKVIIL